MIKYDMDIYMIVASVLIGLYVICYGMLTSNFVITLSGMYILLLAYYLSSREEHEDNS